MKKNACVGTTYERIVCMKWILNVSHVVYTFKPARNNTKKKTTKNRRAERVNKQIEEKKEDEKKKNMQKKEAGKATIGPNV